jgi:hypothetical protein
MGRGTESHLRSSAGTRSSVDVLVVWMFISVSLIFVFALERMHFRRHQVPRMAITLPDFRRLSAGKCDHFWKTSILQRNLSP